MEVKPVTIGKPSDDSRTDKESDEQTQEHTEEHIAEQTEEQSGKQSNEQSDKQAKELSKEQTGEAKEDSSLTEPHSDGKVKDADSEVEKAATEADSLHKQINTASPSDSVPVSEKTTSLEENNIAPEVYQEDNEEETKKAHSGAAPEDSSLDTFSPPEVTTQHNQSEQEHSASESDSDYDPEKAYDSPDADANTQGTKDEQRRDAGASEAITEDGDDHDDEYDPERDLVAGETDTNAAPSSEQTDMSLMMPLSLHESKSRSVTPSLPSKPVIPATANDPNSQFQKAYDVIMLSEFVKLSEFSKLSEPDQLKWIKERLDEQGVLLPSTDQSSAYPGMNYDQVYSYNKPHKSKDLIPLVPINKHCRRPNITLPMTAEEQTEYAEFIRNEEKFSGWNARDQFPDNLRMFIGNLPANTISKADLFRIFKQYGDVAQISIKGGYGFVQFRTAEQCASCIEGEHDVPLHNKYMRLDASTGRKRAQEEKRGREREGSVSEASTLSADCQLLVTEDASPAFVEELQTIFAKQELLVSVEEIGSKDPGEVIPDVAYLGVLGACVVKEHKIDLQTFEETEDGGIRFDEYVELSPQQAVEIILKKKDYLEEPPKKARKEDKPFMRNDRGPRETREPRHRGGHKRRERHQGHNNRWQNDRSRNRWNQPNTNDLQRPNFLPPNPAFAQYGTQLPLMVQYPQQMNYPNVAPQPPQAFEQPYSSPANSASGFSNPSPALLQTLQSLDPATMQNVISLLQQQQNKNQGFSASQQQAQFASSPYNYQGYAQMQYGHPPTPPAVAQSGQLNNLLSLLRTSSQPPVPVQSQMPYPNNIPFSGQSSYQSPAMQQPYPVSPQVQQQPSSQQQNNSGALMDMLARLSKQ